MDVEMSPLPHDIVGSVVTCADGGSNRLYDTMGPLRNRYCSGELTDVTNTLFSYIPHVICGDLDSARQEVIQFYKDKVNLTL